MQPRTSTMGRKQPGRKQPFKRWSRLGLLGCWGLGMASGAIATPTAASGLTPGLTQASHSQASHSQASHSQASHSPAIAQAPQPNWTQLEQDVITEQNRLRQNPQSYLPLLQARLNSMDAQGNIPGGCGPRCTLRTVEGKAAVQEAIAFLRQQQPLSALSLAPAAAQAAKAHAADQRGGAIGHVSSDGSQLRQRLQRAGLRPRSWGENITYGSPTAQDVVLSLLIDDNVPNRGHRKNIFAPNWNQVGSGCGPHRLYRAVCVINYIQAAGPAVSGPAVSGPAVSGPAAAPPNQNPGKLAAPPASSPSVPATSPAILSARQIQELLDAHNAYRQALGLPNLTWSPAIASNAQAWAEQLATKNQFQHSPAGSPYRSKSHGENITYGRGRASSLKAMVDRWGAERQFFRNGTMPNLSTTGNWADVGHYSQIVWRKTSQLGCGFAKGGQGAEYLVCQYNPAGNVLGQKPF